MEAEGISMAIAGLPVASLRFYSDDMKRKTSAKVYELRSGDELADITSTIPDTLLHQVRGSISATGGKTITSATLTLKDSAQDGLSISAELGEADSFVFAQVPLGT